jgi:multidrug transporter EmrE-like cation transporter
VYYLLALFNVVLISIGQIFLKKSALVATENFIEKLININFITGLFFYGVSTLMWIVILKHIKLSVAYPMMSLSYVIVMIAAQIFFHEKVEVVQWTGIILIIMGVGLIASK